MGPGPSACMVGYVRSSCVAARTIVLVQHAANHDVRRTEFRAESTEGATCNAESPPAPPTRPYVPFRCTQRRAPRLLGRVSHTYCYDSTLRDPTHNISTPRPSWSRCSSVAAAKSHR